MRLDPSFPALPRRAAAVGAALAATVFLASCDADSADGDSFSFDEWFSSSDGETGDAAAEEEPTAEESAAEGEAPEEEPSPEEAPEEEPPPEEEPSPDGDAAAEEDTSSAEDDGSSWFDDFVSWVGDLFSSDEGGESAESADGEDDGTEESEEESVAAPAIPDSCDSVGAHELATGLAPAGALMEEDRSEIEGVADAEQVSCVWSSPESGESFALVFTVNADPGSRLQVAQLPGEEEMNWEVDVDVDVDNYRDPRADALGGELDYVATVEGSTQSLHLSLPEDTYVSVIAVASQLTQEELEAVVFEAAERIGG